MITSAGGCCDCGDPEAWTDGVHCSLHQPKENLPPKEVNVSGGSEVLLTHVNIEQTLGMWAICFLHLCVLCAL